MKFIQVGVGGFGKRWAKVLSESPHAEVAGLVDTSEEALAACRAEHGHAGDRCFSSLRDALAKVEADALVCVTPPELHREVTCAAMEAGLDVITEKPMAGSPQDCRAMLECSLSTGRVCAVSQNYRYSPETWTMAELVRRGEIGRVGQVRVDFFNGVDFGGGFRHEMDYPLLVDMSIHHFDLLRFITGLDATSARGEAWNPPWSNYRGDASSTVLFEMTGGARALYSGSWCSKGRFCDWNGDWQIEGELGTISFAGGEIRLHRAPKLYDVEEVVEVQKVAPPSEAQFFVLDDFVEAVGAGRRPRTDLADNIRSIGMVFAAVEAVRSGERAPVLTGEVRELAGRLSGGES
ncbi:MAG: Gfo/Idh/MocA family protein [Planctomycetota bacterium]|jgi:predicted dehydrogenase